MSGYRLVCWMVPWHGRRSGLRLSVIVFIRRSGFRGLLLLLLLLLLVVVEGMGRLCGWRSCIGMFFVMIILRRLRRGGSMSWFLGVRKVGLSIVIFLHFPTLVHVWGRGLEGKCSCCVQACSALADL